MHIRYGYELTFTCPQPTMMVCLLDAHRERSQELRYDATDIPLVTSFGPHTLKTFRVWTDEVDEAVLADLMHRRG
jgi:hypothetical protein